MIEARNLTKRYKKKVAVDDLSFAVENGKVTGFLGPNGAGKSTTMRLMLGLDNGRGTTRYDGKALREYPQPSKVVGILLEAKAFHPTRSARSHLRVLADAGGIPRSRVDEVLDIVGLTKEAKSKPGKFSLGMSQRLGIAAAILGEPKYLILDEPANGLDPEGMAWLRQFLRDYAQKDRAVFVSSHLLSEMSQMADNVVVIGRGRLIVDTSINKLISGSSADSFIRSTNSAALEKLLKSKNIAYKKEGAGLLVEDTKTDELGRLAFANKITLLELAPRTASLEKAFLELTESSEEFVGTDSRKAKQ